jgi:tRNA 2-thiouridine synthesizing protein D
LEENSNNKTLTIVLNRGPFISEYADMAVELAIAAKKKGHNVNLYLYLDGVWVPHVKRDKDFSNVGDRLRWAIKKGVNVKSCARCADEARDLTEEDMIKGVPLVGIYSLVDWLKESDKVVTFTG